MEPSTLPGMPKTPISTVAAQAAADDAYNWVGQKRPSANHDEVKRRAIAELLPAVIDWLKGTGEEDPDEAEVAQQLARCVETNGYEFARKLDSDGWRPDASLVEILDGYTMHRALNQCVSEWLAQNGVKPKFAVGTQVVLTPEWLARNIFMRNPPNGTVVAELVDYSPMPAGCYLLFVPAFGHVRTGLGTHGQFATWESVEQLQPLPAAQPTSELAAP